MRIAVFGKFTAGCGYALKNACDLEGIGAHGDYGGGRAGAQQVFSKPHLAGRR